MAMYPNAAHGYMPFVANGKRQTKQRASIPNDKSKSSETKTYRVTLRDRQGCTYTYIIQADGTKSLPVLCDKMNTPAALLASSLPNIKSSSCRSQTAIRHALASSDTVDKAGKTDESAKKGIFNSLLRFIKKRTTSSKPSKSKRKPRPLPQRKRQRTISAMSNLDPIQESPEEDNLEEEEEEEGDDESYNHDSSTSEGENDSLGSAPDTAPVKGP